MASIFLLRLGEGKKLMFGPDSEARVKILKLKLGRNADVWLIF